MDLNRRVDAMIVDGSSDKMIYFGVEVAASGLVALAEAMSLGIEVWVRLLG